MRWHLSLTTKVLLFVSVPLLIQIGLLFALASLQSEAEQALKAATHSQIISDKINRITADIFEIVQRYKSMEALENIPLNDDLGTLMIGRLHRDYAALIKLTKHQPEIFKAVIRSETATNEALEQYVAMKDAFLSAVPKTRAERFLIARRFRKNPDAMVIKQLISIGEQQQKIFEKAPEEQAVFRQKAQAVMIFLGSFNLMLGVALSLFLTRGITTRLERVSENTLKLASGLPLHSEMPGSDEIAKLDQVFHRMANEIKEASRKERVVVESVRDFICTIDSNGRFKAANPASLSLLGIAPAALLGRHVVDLIVSSDKHKALGYLEALKLKSVSMPLEIEMHTASEATIETVWSAHFSTEEDSVFCVVHDVTDKRRAEKLRKEVTAMITHDLRSPLSTINNVLDFFETFIKGDGDDRVNYYLQMARRNTERMITLTNDLLDIEKIKSGNMTLDVETFDLMRCFSNCENLSSVFAEESGVKLIFEKTELFVEADEKFIDRVISNLVANAIKFSPNGKTVRVSAEVDRDFALIRVKDEGPGVPSDQLELVFERFRQARGPGANSKGGSGLGLAICKAIVELHGGRIWVECNNGSTFSFTVPLASSQASVDS